MLVAEADESDRSFLNLRPTFGIVTNIDLEHLETYHDLADITESFKKFLDTIPFYGQAIVCTDNENIRSLLPTIKTPYISYGLDHPADFYAYNIQLEGDRSHFTIKHQNMVLGTASLAIPGSHNVLNRLAAIAIAHTLDIPFDIIAHALTTFAGVERRFSFEEYFGRRVF